ncbi:hypothetical protein B296_00013507 [Ensete ventricosum]|uniref:Uncharacterized protein n=1 Tax=Ensete ventricosum TaxID=4639 RepID=A0A427APT8_ENSVE|nr:hypothetical protein B296_00013507 [Ensete ventricosum]
MSYRVFGILRQSIDQGLNPVYPRFSFFLRALYPKESSLRLVEFLQARFKNIEAGFHRCNLGEKPVHHKLFLSPRDRRRFSPRSAEKPAGDGSRSRE